VARALILETTFLIDLERETAHPRPGPALRFLEKNTEDSLYLTFTIAGELAAGRDAAGREAWEEFLAPFHLLSCTPEVCWRYGEAYRYLRENGRLIGTNDLWIAATAVAFAMPLVTRNERHFRRVPGLQVLAYLAESGGSD